MRLIKKKKKKEKNLSRLAQWMNELDGWFLSY